MDGGAHYEHPWEPSTSARGPQVSDRRETYVAGLDIDGALYASLVLSTLARRDVPLRHARGRVGQAEAGTTMIDSPMLRTVQGTPTDYWNDSCSADELEYAIQRGATGATSNPNIVYEVLK